jgi:hypothetical protein
MDLQSYVTTKHNQYRQTDTTKLIVAFRNFRSFVNLPKNGLHLVLSGCFPVHILLGQVLKIGMNRHHSAPSNVSFTDIVHTGICTVSCIRVAVLILTRSYGRTIPIHYLLWFESCSMYIYLCFHVQVEALLG